MHKRGSWYGRTVAAALPAMLLLLSSASSASPVKPVAEFQVAPLAGVPLAAAGRARAARLSENRSLPAGGWVETGPGDRALVWLKGRPGCQLILEGGGRVQIDSASGEYVARLDRGTLSSTRMDCQATIDVSTPVARVRSQGAYFTVKAADGGISVFHQAGNLNLLFQGQVIPLRALTLTTISSSGSHRIASVTEEEQETAPASSGRAGRQETPAAQSISPVSAPGQP